MGSMAGRNIWQPARVRLTYDDLLLLPDDGLRHELIDGEHVVTPSPNLRHQQILGRLHLAVGNWLAAHPLGQVFFAPLDLVFTTVDVVVPDLLYVSNQHARYALTDAHARNADLVVEVASPSTRRRDETVKRQLYQRAGVLEYWFVDPDADVVTVHRRAGEMFAAPVRLSSDEGHVLTTPLLPGFELRVDTLFTP